MIATIVDLEISNVADKGLLCLRRVPGDAAALEEREEEGVYCQDVEEEDKSDRRCNKRPAWPACCAKSKQFKLSELGKVINVFESRYLFFSSK